VSARTVGAKNIASSSGCAMSKQILLFLNFGNLDLDTVTVYSHDVTMTIGKAKMVSHCIVATRGVLVDLGNWQSVAWRIRRTDCEATLLLFYGEWSICEPCARGN
jgi:hypothetical protein